MSQHDLAAWSGIDRHWISEHERRQRPLAEADRDRVLEAVGDKSDLRSEGNPSVA